MEEKLKKLVDECLAFVNDLRPSKWKKEKEFDTMMIEMYRHRIASAVIHLCGIDLERDVDTGDLKIDVIDEEEKSVKIQ